MQMKKIAKYIAAYLVLLAFYGGDVATTSLMYFMAGGLYLGLKKELGGCDE